MESIADSMLQRQEKLMLDIEAAEATRDAALKRSLLMLDIEAAEAARDTAFGREAVGSFLYKKYHSHHVLPQLSRVSGEIYNEKGSYMWELSYSSPCEPTEHRIKPFDYYSPPPVTSGYTIGPEAGGGDSGSGSGGGDWGDGSGGGSDWGGVPIGVMAMAEVMVPIPSLC
uniref:Uncharacterized protein n=1 Tax=Halimeda minima TaxID=170427 RepID=A0A386AYX9_9CHLO|nr:hypothetical protein [Halimeda minima]